MYENTKSINPLGGKCEIDCLYCSTKSLRKRYKACAEKYGGPYRLYPKELPKFHKFYGQVFVCGQNDLFAPGVSKTIIDDVVDYIIQEGHPDNLYMFQSKNPERMVNYFWKLRHDKMPLPNRFMLGTTVETNLEYTISNCPSREDRLRFIRFEGPGKRYITVEPIMKFTPSFMIPLSLVDIVYIGADSKNNHLPEPSADEVVLLIQRLRDRGVEVRIKSNLERIIGSQITKLQTNSSAEAANNKYI
jgi:protein gp37